LRRQNLNLVRLPISPHPLVTFKRLLNRAYQKDWQVSSAKRHFLKIFLTTNHKQIKFLICLKFNRYD